MLPENALTVGGKYSPERKGNEQAPRPAMQQALSNLDIQRRANGSSNADQLYMPGFQLAMSAITDGLEVVGAVSWGIWGLSGSIFFIFDSIGNWSLVEGFLVVAVRRAD